MIIRKDDLKLAKIEDRGNDSEDKGEGYGGNL